MESMRALGLGAEPRRDAEAAVMKDGAANHVPSDGYDLDQDHAVSPSGDLDLDLTCPGCDADLSNTVSFARFRVCPSCSRHFPLPARERLGLILDPDGFVETNAALLSLEPLIFHDSLPFPDRLAEAQELLSPPGLAEGVITGVGSIGGSSAMLIVLDLALLGGSIGALAGEKITLALEQAVTGRLPVVAMCAGGRGPERAVEGLLVLAQVAKIAAAAANLRRAGLPLISVLAHPTSGGVYVGLAEQADIVLAEPGARIGLAAGPDPTTQDTGGQSLSTAETFLAHGHLDAIVERPDLRATLADLLDLVSNRGVARSNPEPPAMAQASAEAPRWALGASARHPDRPSGRAYLARLASPFIELRGDRVGAGEPAVVGGIGRLAGVSVVLVAQDRGSSTAPPLGRSGQSATVGLRKADRLMRLAGRLELPLVVLVDGHGPKGGPEAEVEGIGGLLAQAFGRMSTLPVPIVAAILGEVSGVSAMAFGLGDRTLMLEHAVFTVAGVDGGQLAGRAPDRLGFPGKGEHHFSARECQRLGVVDQIVPEPEPAAHADRDLAARMLAGSLAMTLDELIGFGPRALLARRSRRLRTLGISTPEGIAAARREALAMLDLHELPRHLARSIGEWRDRLEARYRTAPRLNRPQLHIPRTDLAARLETIRASVASGRGRVGDLTTALSRSSHETGDAEADEGTAGDSDREPGP
jgi:acetyl-CoA carboxylase carboxyl transferase subunit beta